MEHIAALLLLVSCPEGPASCREVPAPTVAYETLRQCEIDRVAETRMRPKPDYVKATCIAIDPAKAYEEAELVWDVDARGTLTAELVTDDGYAVTRLEAGETGTRAYSR